MNGKGCHWSEHGYGLGEAARTIGLASYAKQAVDRQFGRRVMLHVQSSALRISTRPRMLNKGKRT